ncbi:MAG: hypothetical protein ACTS4V_00560 [Candidatus Hodgkinia cicadicola]
MRLLTYISRTFLLPFSYVPLSLRLPLSSFHRFALYSAISETKGTKCGKGNERM